MFNLAFGDPSWLCLKWNSNLAIISKYSSCYSLNYFQHVWKLFFRNLLWYVLGLHCCKLRPTFLWALQLHTCGTLFQLLTVKSFMRIPPIMRENQCFHHVYSGIIYVYAPSQWETTLQCNVFVSHWLGASIERSLVFVAWCQGTYRDLC